MREELLPDLARRLRDRATNTVWIQWAALGTGAVSKRAARSVLDPEALVLASLGLVDHERHLGPLLAGWAETDPGLLSVQRVRNLAPSYPALVGPRLEELAVHAWRVGGDHRWKSVVSGKPEAGGKAQGATPLTLTGPTPLVLRLRLGLGVGIKADVVAALLGSAGWWTVRELTSATGYTRRAVARVAAELARGGWVEASPATPAEYRGQPERWLPLLGLEAAPPWRPWHGLLSFVLAVDEWIGAGEWRGEELVATERAARRLLESHLEVFKWTGVELPEPVSRPGAEYLEGFARAALGVAGRMEEEV